MVESITSSNSNLTVQQSQSMKRGVPWQTFRDQMYRCMNAYTKENGLDPTTIHDIETVQYDKMDEYEQSLFNRYVSDKIVSVKYSGINAAKAYDYKEFKRRQITFPPVDAPTSVKRAWENTLAKLSPAEAGKIQRYIKYTLLGFHGKELLQSKSCYDFINKQMDALSKSHQENGTDVSFFLGFFKDFMQELEKEEYKGEPTNKDTNQP